MTTPSELKLATRGSALALWQANEVRRQLRRAWPGLQVELVLVESHGDRVVDVPLSALGGVGVFTRAIQAAVLDGRADLAVHSLKDLPTLPHPELVLAATLERGSPMDALVGAPLAELPKHARVATGSPRRRSMLLAARPDLEIVDLRGNVDTRLRKLDEGRFDAMVLAQAGLERIGFVDRVAESLAPPAFVPAPAQGAVGIESRREAHEIAEMLQPLNHLPTRCAVDAERALLAELEAGCRLPVGAYATTVDGVLRLQATVLSIDGSQRLDDVATGGFNRAVDLGRALGKRMLDHGAAKLFGNG